MRAPVSFLLWFLILTSCLAGIPAAPGQDAGKEAPSEVVEPPPPTRAEQLRDRLLLIRQTEEQIRKLKAELTAKPPPSPEVIQTRQQEIETLTERRKTMESDLRSDIAGVPDLDGTTAPDADIQQQLEQAVRPALDFVSELMKQPREIDELRRNIARHQGEITQLTRALEGTVKTAADVTAALTAKPSAEDQELLRVLQLQADGYRTRLSILTSELESLKTRLDTILSERKSVGHYAGQLMSDYVIQRVWNLLLALLTFGGLLAVLRWIHQWMRRRNFLRRIGLSPFLSRVADVIYYGLSVFVSAAAGFIVLYASSDWLLLSVAMLLVAGLILLSRQTLPRFYEQAKLMLNLGSVREGERVIWQGLPWLVKRLHVFSELSNPSLTGGLVRLPLRHLEGMASRPFAPKERWFPTEEGQWVELDDGTFGKVVLQTPEMVQLVPVGGSFKTYPTTAWLAQNPRSLSHQFRITSTFGLDYRHLEIITTEIPAILVRNLRQELLHTLDPDDILSVKVELAAAGASSLDLAILTDFSGKAAPQYNSLPRLIQTVCVRTAVAEGWTIPFPQVVMHRAGAGEA